MTPLPPRGIAPEPRGGPTAPTGMILLLLTALLLTLACTVTPARPAPVPVPIRKR